MENITAGTDELLEEGHYAVESWASAVETELRDLVNSHRKAMSSARGEHGFDPAPKEADVIFYLVPVVWARRRL